MKNLVLTILFVFIVSITPDCFSQEVLLKYDFFPKQSVDFIWNGNSNGLIGPSKEENVIKPFEQETILELRYRVKKVEPNGNGHLDVSFEYLKTSSVIDNSSHEIEFTRTRGWIDGKKVWEKGKSKIDNPFWVMTGNRASITIDPSGNILTVDGDSNWTENRNEAFPVQWRKNWIPLPNKKVKPGYTWESDVLVELPNSAEGIPAKAVCEFKEIKRINGVSCAVITQDYFIKDGTAEFSTAIGLNSFNRIEKKDNVSPIHIMKLNSFSHSEVIFNLEKRMIVEINQSGKLESEINLIDTNIGVVPVKVPLYQKQNFTNRLVTKIKK